MRSAVATAPSTTSRRTPPSCAGARLPKNWSPIPRLRISYFSAFRFQKLCCNRKRERFQKFPSVLDDIKSRIIFYFELHRAISNDRPPSQNTDHHPRPPPLTSTPRAWGQPLRLPPDARGAGVPLRPPPRPTPPLPPRATGARPPVR